MFRGLFTLFVLAVTALGTTVQEIETTYAKFQVIVPEEIKVFVATLSFEDKWAIVEAMDVGQQQFGKTPDVDSISYYLKINFPATARKFDNFYVSLIFEIAALQEHAANAFMESFIQSLKNTINLALGGFSPDTQWIEDFKNHFNGFLTVMNDIAKEELVTKFPGVLGVVSEIGPIET